MVATSEGTPSQLHRIGKIVIVCMSPFLYYASPRVAKAHVNSFLGWERENTVFK